MVCGKYQQMLDGIDRCRGGPGRWCRGIAAERLGVLGAICGRSFVTDWKDRADVMQLHQLLGPVMSILITVPLGPHPPSGPSQGQPTPYELRVRAGEVLKRIAELYGPRYPGLLPRKWSHTSTSSQTDRDMTQGLTSTLTKSLNSSPFPSPLGAAHPPAGRYEGSLLGLAAIGSHAVKSAMWGADGTPILRVDDLSVRLYPGSETKKAKTGLTKAFVKAAGVMVGPKPETFSGTADMDQIGREFGWSVAKGLEKRPWVASELLRMKSEVQENMAVDVVSS